MSDQDQRGTSAASGDHWRKLSVELKRHPGRWALVATDANVGFTGLLRQYGLEACSRSAGKGYPKGHADIYARCPDPN